MAAPVSRAALPGLRDRLVDCVDSHWLAMFVPNKDLSNWRGQTKQVRNKRDAVASTERQVQSGLKG